MLYSLHQLAANSACYLVLGRSRYENSVSEKKKKLSTLALLACRAASNPKYTSVDAALLHVVVLCGVRGHVHTP